jgi:hypothetical protein
MIGKPVEQGGIVRQEVLSQDGRDLRGTRLDWTTADAGNLGYARIGDEMGKDVGADETGCSSENESS